MEIPKDGFSKRHEATYDADGNIVLPAASPVIRYVEDRAENPPVTTEDSPVITEESYSVSALDKGKNVLTSIRENTAVIARGLLDEGANEVRVSLAEIREIGVQGTTVSHGVIRTFWSFLTQPVWVMRKAKPPREYSRFTLFALDTVRFGGTFAALFVALFLSLNYQSFWEIIRHNIDPVEGILTTTSSIDATLQAKLMKSPLLATAGLTQGDGQLLSFLPEVGPPDNRLIVPKLGLNVPIVDPSVDALLKEDWVQVEKDIQTSLETGVVHYPGTARPGQAGNFFVTGHSSYYPWAAGKYKSVFARLGLLQKGDEYWVYFGGDKHRYFVTNKEEVNPSNVDVLNQPTNKRVATLMTCTPVGTTLRRLIIQAQEVDPETGAPLDVGEQPERTVPQYRMDALPI